MPLNANIMNLRNWKHPIFAADISTYSETKKETHLSTLVWFNFTKSTYFLPAWMYFSVKSINHPAHLLSRVSLLPWRSKLANELPELPPLWAGRAQGGVASNACHLLAFASLIAYLKYLNLSFTLWGHSRCTCDLLGNLSERFWFSSNGRREVTIEEVNLTLYWKVCHHTKQNKTKKPVGMQRRGGTKFGRWTLLISKCFLCVDFFHLTIETENTALAMSFYNIFKC